MKLISMTSFVLEQYNERMDTPYNDGALVESDAYKWVNYAKFLKQPLKLGMFIPCDQNGYLLDEPQPIHTLGLEVDDYEYDDDEILIYKNALDRVLFEGFLVGNYPKSINNGILHVFWNRKDKWSVSRDLKTIEDLIPYNLTLIKEI